eukprot:CAMPEP_0185204246 /NCGR_PEP_ID=MMETSP1140-20130426/54468_1 /TAXON_ID=298111 /ORGANISM="Pavlova sp., Strain CCMP459" /LENGTH=185 /DNA_ID=CAMNT_0027771787 /DNA_START=50 /DNA_END=604 /DNA_ORIENTATION=-
MSVHCGKNFPFRKSRSDLDVDLPPGTGDADYLAAVRDVLPRVLQVSRPDIVLYDAGVDVAAQDELGYFDLSEQGMLDRDRYVIEACLDARVPVATVIGGGYAKDLDELAARHALIFRAASAVWDDRCMGTMDSTAPVAIDTGHPPAMTNSRPLPSVCDERMTSIESGQYDTHALRGAAGGRPWSA